MSLHPAPAASGRDQTINREEESALSLADVGVDLSVQDLRRLLAGDDDPHLRYRLVSDLEAGLERLRDRRRWDD